MRVPDDFESSNEFSSPQLLHSRLAHFCMKEHLWQNPRGRGRPISGLEASAELPWIEGVACQRFFPSREGSKWFEFLQETRNSKKGARLAKSSRPDLSKDVRSLNCEARAYLSDGTVAQSWELPLHRRNFYGPLNEGRSNSAEHENKESTGNNDEDDFDPEGEDDDNGDGDWDSEDNELDHDDYTYGSDQAEFSREAHPELQIQPDIELDIEAFDDFLEPLYKVCLTFCMETFIAGQPGSTPLVY
ncbi:hypothetical protein FOFC_16019 [Fusarium oxysporum]|nr:hypothetical protein FOFC_16019 [Fusarium oxysporum]